MCVCFLAALFLFSFHVHKRFAFVSHDTDEIWRSRCWQMWKRSVVAVAGAAVRGGVSEWGGFDVSEFDA